MKSYAEITACHITAANASLTFNGPIQHQARRSSPQRLKKELQVSPGKRGSSLLHGGLCMVVMLGVAAAGVFVWFFHSSASVLSRQPKRPAAEFRWFKTAQLGTTPSIPRLPTLGGPNGRP